MKALISIFFIYSTLMLSGQTVLDGYVKYGIENNLTLQQKQTSYQKSIETLREARALFYPDLLFQSRYTRSEGGRVIDLPVGDLLNPVYMTLNSLTGMSMFPVIENQQVKFLRPHEHETKLRLIQPVINTDIYYNSRIKKEMIYLGEEDVNQFIRELTAEIKKAYYNAAMADGIYNMMVKTRNLLTENVRVNRKLIDNDKVTLDYLYRSEAELDKFDQELRNAEKNRLTATAYFNFLLNKPLYDSIIIQQPDTFPTISGLEADYLLNAKINREELAELQTYGRIADLKYKMDNFGKIPDLVLAVDYGFQGEEYRFNKEQDYVQASAILSWSLFKGFENRSKIRQSRLDKEMADLKLEEAQKQIELQVITTMNELSAAEKGIAAAESRLRNARESFRLVNRKFEEGQASQIEFIDARTTLTQAEENLIISRFNYLSGFAEFEKAAAIGEQE
jgi:outer membrane protein TolC